MRDRRRVPAAHRHPAWAWGHRTSPSASDCGPTGAAMGSAVLMVSSDEEELISITKMTPDSKVLVMYEGHIVQVLTGKDINKDNISLAAMQVKERD